ncbi:hypothetical protein DXP70_08165 [Listeria monocytogenes]|nr:hypothetical protein [Listeria monocytogenes]MDB03034.1 hypothetical protein [Listeria monocytogenes]MDB35378.1 hypothetical protein [Listeria monocytogenes]
MKGAFQMSREIFDNDIWTDIIKFRIFFFIVGNAVFSENGVTKGGIQVGRGQYLRSFRNLREDLVYYDNNAEKLYSLNTIKTKIDELVTENRLQIKTTKLGTLFTVCNYALYQDLSNYKADSTERQKNSHRTATEQPQNNNKNVKNEKNDKKDNNTRRNKFDDTHLSLANLLNNLIHQNNEEAKQPNIESWANDLRIMIEQDKRDPEKVKNAIIWSQKDDFWSGVVLSPKSLRKNYDKMAAQRNRDSKPTYKQNGRKAYEPDWLDKEPEEITTKPVDPNLNQQVEEIKRKLREEREHVSSRE